MVPTTTRPLLWCLGAAALFGASTPASKALLSTLGPFTLAGLLYLGAAAAVVVPAARAASPSARVKGRQWLLVAGCAIFGGGLAPVLLLLGLRAAPAASVSLWLNLEPVFTAVLAWSLFHEHLDRRAWFASFLVLAAGVTATAGAGVATASAAALVAAACASWAVDNNLTAQVDAFTPAQLTFVKGLAAGGVNLLIGTTLEARGPGLSAVAAAVGVGAACYGASLVLYIRGSQALGAARAQMCFAAAPFFGAALAWLALDEQVTATQGLAATVLAFALWLLFGSRHAHEHVHEPLEHVHAHRHDDGHHDHPHLDLPRSAWHSHPHSHARQVHAHPHEPDLHHRHSHD